MQVDRSNWSGDGSFTKILIDRIVGMDEVMFLRVEDADATRSDAGYNFISNEIYMTFKLHEHLKRERRFGIVPVTKTILKKVFTLMDLEALLSAVDSIGPPDYSDESLIQYLRTERIIPPYQTKGYKLVELVRIYEVGAEPLFEGSGL